MGYKIENSELNNRGLKQCPVCKSWDVECTVNGMTAWDRIMKTPRSYFCICFHCLRKTDTYSTHKEAETAWNTGNAHGGDLELAKMHDNNPFKHTEPDYIKQQQESETKWQLKENRRESL